MEGEIEVIKAPYEAPYLLGKRGLIVHKEGRWICVRIGDAFTHFCKQDIKPLGNPQK